MIAGVIKDEDDSTRQYVERRISSDLAALGYNAVLALEVFGKNGLANLSQEATYRQLCSRGIDAVIVVALIDKNKEKQFRTKRYFTYPDNYYYDRIWNYKDIQADLSVDDPARAYFWEAILFNLNTLEAECTIQSPAFTSLDDSNAYNFEKLLVGKMLREKILKRQNTPPLKPF